MSDKSSVRTRTTQALLEGYSSLSVPKLLSSLSPNFAHKVLPASLGIPHRDKAAFAECAAGIFDTFEQFRMVPEGAFEDEVQGVVIIHARMEGTLKKNKGQWNNECMLIVRFTEDGSQVKEIEEFVDSQKALEMKRKHSPLNFMNVGTPEDVEGLARVRNMVIFTCLAAGTYFGVRRLLR